MTRWIELSAIKQAKKAAGLYVVYCERKVFYVGSTRDVRARLRDHARPREGIFRDSDKCWDSVTSIKVRYSVWRFEEIAAEHSLISRLSPPGNRRIVQNYRLLNSPMTVNNSAMRQPTVRQYHPQLSPTTNDTLRVPEGTEATDYITIREAARRLGVSRTTVYKWIAKHGFPVVRIAGRPVVSVAKMHRWHESWAREKQNPAWGRNPGGVMQGRLSRRAITPGGPT